MSRHRTLERLQERTRAQIPRAAVKWLAAARTPLEKLTKAALSGQVTDAEFRAMVEKFSKDLPGLLDKMDHGAIAKPMEDGMGAALANGIAERQKTSRQKTEEKRAKLPWETDAYLAAGKGKRCGNGWISPDKKCRVDLPDEKWSGNAKAMQARADAVMRGFPRLSHPGTGMEMDFNRDGRDKTLSAMRDSHEFQAAAKLQEIFLDSEASPPEPDRRNRKGIDSFVKFRAPVRIGTSDYEAEIITRKIAGNDVLKFYHFRITPAQKSRK